MRKIWLHFCVAFFWSSLAFGGDVWLVQGSADGQTVQPPTLQIPEMIVWSTDAFFYNSNSVPAIIRLVSISNGSIDPSTPTDFSVSPRATTSLSAARVLYAWSPKGGSPLWVVHIQVPDGVMVDDALYVRAWPQILPNPTFNPVFFKYGKIRLPVFAALLPPQQAQVTLATTLGDPDLNPSHSNVAIYNGGDVTAHGTIEIRQHCDDTIMYSQPVTIPPNTILQFPNFPTSGRCAPGTLWAPSMSVYTIVTLDQPGFSFVSTLANNSNPLTSISVASP